VQSFMYTVCYFHC